MKEITKRRLQVVGAVFGLTLALSVPLLTIWLSSKQSPLNVGATSKGDTGDYMQLGGAYSSLYVRDQSLYYGDYRPFKGSMLNAWTYTDYSGGVMADMYEFEFTYWDSQTHRKSDQRTGEYALIFPNYAYDALNATQFQAGFVYYSNFDWINNYSWDYNTSSAILVLNDEGNWAFQFIGSFRVYAGDYNTYSQQTLPYYLATDTTSAGGDWQNGYGQGFDDGVEQGEKNKEDAYADDMQDAYNRGKAYGESHSGLGPTGTIGGLILTIVSVPLTILNGFQPFAVYQVPLMAILMSFLFIALIMWLIKKLI